MSPQAVSIAVIKREQQCVENKKYYLSDVKLKKRNNTSSVSESKIIFSVADDNRLIDA